MSLFLKNANYLDWQTLKCTNGHIKVNHGLNEGIEFIDEIPPINNDDEIIDLKGKLVTHAFACGHHHIYSGLARGMPFVGSAPNNFLEILQKIWWKLDRKLDLDMIKACAYATAMQSAKAGVSFVIDHHSSPFHIDGALETIAKAFDEVGVGHLLCIEHSDRDGEETRDKNIHATIDYLNKCKDSNNPTYQGMVGMHASFTVGDELLQRSIEIANDFDCGIHLHVAEDLMDESATKQRHGMRVIERLREFGGLNSKKSIFAHCLHLDEKERSYLCGKDKPFIAVNTDSNLNNRVGIFSGKGLDESQIMMGTDGMYSDMILSCKNHFYATHMLENTDMMQVYNRLRNVNRYLQSSWKGDGENNLVIFDYDAPTPVTGDNFLGHLFFGLQSAHVQSVISRGEIIVKDRAIVKVDESEVLKFTHAQAERLWAELVK